MRLFHCVAAWSALLVVGCSAAPRRPALGVADSTPDREVVVLLVVDQLAAWVAEERLPHLPGDGGFARLLREGGGMRVLEHGHLVTDTAPGHAALMTGTLPHEHGIAANERILPDGSRASILRDDATRLVDATGPRERPGASLASLRVPTLADRLRARRPDAWIVSLSLKDRAALFGGGRSPDASIYYDPALDGFVTSTAFASELPTWAGPLAASASLAERRRTPWQLLDSGFVEAHASVGDDAAGEGDLAGFGTRFPHRFEASSRPGHAFRTSPASDEALVDLGLAALASAPDSATPILLVISFSANDYTGHVFGPSSWESWDVQLRLDRQLARLFAELDARFGPEGWSALLSADHGASVQPEQPRHAGIPCGEDDVYERPCGPTVRLDPDGIASRIESAARAELGAGTFVAGFADPYLHFTALGRTDAVRPRLLAIVERELAGMAGIDAVVPLASDARCPEGDVERLCASWVAGFGDVFVEPTAGAFFDSTYVPGYGAGHGSPGMHDRRVPLLGRLSAAARARRIELPMGPGEVVPFDSFFGLADALLGGGGVSGD